MIFIIRIDRYFLKKLRELKFKSYLKIDTKILWTIIKII
ncbi:hypothetical protein ENHY17A_110023 [Moraxellaceae bacterium 17A]|nr:hypothetical protein ENHY17A_110023 [Moraxellaceae bacterium 17A]